MLNRQTACVLKYSGCAKKLRRVSWLVRAGAKLALVAAALHIVWIGPAHAAEPEPEPEPEPKSPTHAQSKVRLVFDNMLALRVAPYGLVNRFSLALRRDLSSRNEPLFSDSHIALRAVVSATPTFLQGGGRLEIQPLAVIKIGLSAQRIFYFGNLGNLQSAGDASADFSPDTLIANQRAELSYSAGGNVFSGDILLQAKVGNLVVRNEAALQWSAIDLRMGDTVYFDRLLDSAVFNEGWVLTSNADVLYLATPRLYLGARYTLIEPTIGGRRRAVLQDDLVPIDTIQRLGPALLFDFSENDANNSRRWSVFLLTQWHLMHPYRRGQEVSAGVPSVMAGVILSSDLWRPHRRPQALAKRN